MSWQFFTWNFNCSYNLNAEQNWMKFLLSWYSKIPTAQSVNSSFEWYKNAMYPNYCKYCSVRPTWSCPDQSIYPIFLKYTSELIFSFCSYISSTNSEVNKVMPAAHPLHILPSIYSSKWSEVPAVSVIWAIMYRTRTTTATSQWIMRILRYSAHQRRYYCFRVLQIAHFMENFREEFCFVPCKIQHVRELKTNTT